VSFLIEREVAALRDRCRGVVAAVRVLDRLTMLSEGGSGD